jgi:hypothetical protein
MLRRFSLWCRRSEIIGMYPAQEFPLRPSFFALCPSQPYVYLLSDTSRWVERLPELFKQFNLENIENVFAFEQPWQSKMASDMSCAVAHEMENNGSPFLTEKIKTIGVSVPLAYAEVAKGARVVQPFCVAIGRKPEQDESSNSG